MPVSDRLHSSFHFAASTLADPPFVGPWDRSTFAISNDHAEQIAQACSNVDFVLRDAGGAGWSQVFRVNSYHVPLTHEAMELMAAQFEKWMPNHKPIWTCIGSPRLGDEKMRIEIEVVAHVG